VIITAATRKRTFPRFLSKIDRSAGPRGCWLWLKSASWDGYGYFRFMGKVMLAHRVAYSLRHGEVPPSDTCVLHSCDNPSCVNPRHLFLGTRLDNNVDRESKGRGNHPKGRCNGNSKLRESDVRWIRRLYWKYSVSQQEIANRFSISTGPVYQIVHYRTWRHVR
jgi:hypothetical protein